MSRDHERIWLQNAEDAKHQCEGRMWCEDKVWPDEPEEGEPTEYVRADLYASLAARISELEAALAEMIYETTHLSPENDDGSHWCKISRETLARARSLTQEEKRPLPEKERNDG